MWIVKHPEGSQTVKGSETIVMAEHFGQAVDDYETVWNKEHRMNRDIGYPVIQGTADKSFRYKKDVVRKAREVSVAQLENEWFKLPESDKIKLWILAGTEPKFRPDISFNIRVVNQGARRRVFKIMRENALLAPLNLVPRNQIMGIHNVSDTEKGGFDLNIIEDGEVVQRNFKTLREAKLAKEALKEKGFINHQIDEEERIPLVITQQETGLEQIMKTRDESTDKDEIAKLDEQIRIVERYIKSEEEGLDGIQRDPSSTPKALMIVREFKRSRN